jgi:hypothetical protein
VVSAFRKCALGACTLVQNVKNAILYVTYTLIDYQIHIKTGRNKWFL